MSQEDPSETKRKPRLSRETIEKLCLLHLVGSTGCSPTELAERMAMSPRLGEEMLEAAQPLIAVGMLARTEGRISLTSHGRQWLDEQLAEVGLD